MEFPLMAFRKILILSVLVTAAVCQLNDVSKPKHKSKTSMATEKEQKLRSAHPDADPQKGSFEKLNHIMKMNSTLRQNQRRKGADLSKINRLNREHKHLSEKDMLNDNEGILIENQNISQLIDTYTLTDKMKDLRRDGSAYEAINKNHILPHVTGVFCNFEAPFDLCMWDWNSTLSTNGLGFRIMSPQDLTEMNETNADFKFTGPTTDSDGNNYGHFLYLPVDPSMENMVVKSPPFRGLWEFCKFEVSLHESGMQNATIRLVSEATDTQVQWIMVEFAGNNFEIWQTTHFMIGRIRQEVRLMVEITRPLHVSPNQPLPHIAIDNIRMLECLPEPPVFNGDCHKGQLKCNIMNQASCIKPQQICDLVKDCDDGSDENQNCDKMPYGAYCNFESDDCGFVDVPQKVLKWKRHFGPTPTDKTGPNYDHTCGPTTPYPTHMIPPLTPAYLNYTVSSCLGYYFFVNMNVTGPNKERADFASSAIMYSAVFNPPPTVHGNLSSPYYNSCMIRFYYQQNGRNYGSLSVDLMEMTPRENISTPLWFSSKDKGENWYRADIFLPNVTRRYFFRFKTRMGMRIYSDSAIDDFSLAPACFGLNIPLPLIASYNYYEPVLQENTTVHHAFVDIPVYRFTPCGAVGRFGPNQTMCDQAYANTSVEVTVIDEEPFKGIQVWEVPSEGYYTIIAVGGGGGLGSARAGISRAAVITGIFYLDQGEKLHILPGVKGTNACKKTLSAQESPDCTRPPANDTNKYLSKTHQVRQTEVTDGGGGGGGGTYVFTMNNSEIVPLIIAGGGGGLGVGAFRDSGTQNGREITNSTPANGYMYGPPGETAGAGGGWLGEAPRDAAGGRALAGAGAGGTGGEGCAGAHGGYGGGGGACRQGGGGGGYIGGSTSSSDHGGGGFSFIGTRASKEYRYYTLATHMADGEVLIIPASDQCGCDFRCVALNEWRSEVGCFCPDTWISGNGTECTMERKYEFSRTALLLMGSVITVLISAVLCAFLTLYNSYQVRIHKAKQLKLQQEQEMQLHRLRNAPDGDGLTAFNPHYGADALFPAGIQSVDLQPLSRETLTLKKALGQGAFGEVYQGGYKYRANQEEMAVAVKTLPELSTEQAELDFSMEAAIMAKFNHPNIVRLIGVCFDSHPRFIVLELLPGGDLKNFLRWVRTGRGVGSAGAGGGELSTKDLLRAAADVCRAARYLEAKRFIHRDIAARNCLLTSRGPDRIVKIADFGMARDIYRAEYYKKGGKAMLPIKWMPPEAYIDGLFTSKTDIWSFGVLLWEVFTLGVMPYTGCSNREVMDLVSSGGRLEKPYGCPQEIYRLMCECWNPVDKERPTFSHIYDRINVLMQDQEILDAPLPILKPLMPPSSEDITMANGTLRAPTCDYLVPLTPRDVPPPSSSPDPLIVPSISPPDSPVQAEESHGSLYQHRAKVSQEYGNIPHVGRDQREGDERETKFLQSNSTDRLLSSGHSLDESGSETDPLPEVWETSFSKPTPVRMQKGGGGPPVDKLISITPTSPKPPENILTRAFIEHDNRNKTPKRDQKTTSNSPKPSLSKKKEPNLPKIDPNLPKLYPKAKPLCLDASQLEQNLNALKKNSGSVNLNTMNIVPPYINVVTPNKISESKTIQIDPKKAVIYDLQSPEDVKEEFKLKPSSSAGSLLNGPMTEVPFVDSDRSSSSSSGDAPNHIQTIQKSKQNNYTDVNIGPALKGNGDINNDSEISC